jgi:hypothetical protein
MHVSKDSMWRKIWKILQNFLGTKQAWSQCFVFFGPDGAAPAVAELEEDSRRGQQYLSYPYCANLYYFLMTKHRYH